MEADDSHLSEDLPNCLEVFEIENGDVDLVISAKVIGGSEEYTHIRDEWNCVFMDDIGIFQMKRSSRSDQRS